MSSYVTIAPDGSRDVDVQSLFYDQIEMVRRIARMSEKHRVNYALTTDDLDRAIKNFKPAQRSNAELLRDNLHAAQKRIAKLEAERDDYRERWEQTGCTRHTAMETAIKLAESYRQQLDDMVAERDRLIDELRDAEARNAQKLAEIERLRRALSTIAQKAGLASFHIRTDGVLSSIEAKAYAALESGDE